VLRPNDAMRESEGKADRALSSPALMIKKLRYYARFIVVCLLLNKQAMVKKLMDELSFLVEEYSKTFKPADQCPSTLTVLCSLANKGSRLKRALDLKKTVRQN
jgi:hypothetical protein